MINVLDVHRITSARSASSRLSQSPVHQIKKPEDGVISIALYDHDIGPLLLENFMHTSMRIRVRLWSSGV